MTEEILINATAQETRVAVVESGILREIHIERCGQRGQVGNIIKGRISRVLPGMQAAFVDIGLERAGFLHLADIGAARPGDSGPEPVRPIETLLGEGDELLVQVIKDPIGSKGARLTTRLSLPSRYVVFVPGYREIGISQRIADPEERERLHAAIAGYRGTTAQAIGAATLPPAAHPAGGFIARTAAEHVAEEEIHRDIAFLEKLWAAVAATAGAMAPPGRVHEDLPLAQRTMRDLVHPGIGTVRIDDRDTYEAVVAFSRRFIPEFVDRIGHYTGAHPILDLYSIEDEIQRSLSNKVALKSGGYLVIDQTEAMTTIDVNTGAFVGRRNQEETIYKTNLEAAHAIARQLRLRNLGGIIIVDFIDMQDPEHGRQVLRALEKHTDRDPARTSLSELTSLGLVQLTRKRTRESLARILCDTCPACDGRGVVKTAATVCYDIFREILREVGQFEANSLLIVAAQPVVDRLLDDEADRVAELEDQIGKPISFQVEPLYLQEQYDIVLPLIAAVR